MVINKKFKNNKIVVILGPTSSGKSDVAIWLAKKFDGEIISADSRQIYKGLDIGTGKVLKSKVKSQKSKAFYSSGIRHHIIDIVNPTASYNVSHFKKYAQNIIADILKRDKLPIICGGTGFWIQAIVDNVNFPEVKPDWKLRNKLRNKSAEVLFKMLKKLDPQRAKNIDAKNKIRLIRAIEICQILDKVPRLQGSTLGNSKVEPWKFLQIGISLSKEKLCKNIKKRLQKRFRAGMIEEVKNLHSKDKLSWKIIQSFGLGYYWIPQYLKGGIKNREELFNKVYQAEKDYAKRQMAWFRKDRRIKWLKNYQEIEKEARRFISAI